MTRPVVYGGAEGFDDFERALASTPDQAAIDAGIEEVQDAANGIDATRVPEPLRGSRAFTVRRLGGRALGGHGRGRGVMPGLPRPLDGRVSVRATQVLRAFVDRQALPGLADDPDLW
ncbi:MAG TPA: hypothetical protein VLE99_05110 [Candidatus Saccharimonadales bacterium]|nr:hypothetical protein [Candidatus Saccharimonadales bacterium]